MIWSLFSLFVILLIAGAVVLYVAYPYRGHDVPGAQWFGDALHRGIRAMPVLDNDDLGRDVPQQELPLADAATEPRDEVASA